MWLKGRFLMKNFTLLKLQKMIIALTVVVFFLGLTGFSAKCNDIENSVLRLHVLANSDSKEDQDLKLKVRDAILSSGYDVFAGAESVEEAEKKIVEGGDELLRIAQQVVYDEGFDYPVTMEVTDDNFPTKTYGDVTLPAGTYRAVRIVIGNGEGHNWWCVMFPALCLPGAEDVSIDTVLTDKEIELVESDPDVDVRFKIAEVISFLGKKVAEKNVF